MIILVSNLHSNTTDKNLHSLFKQHGAVHSSHVVKGHFSSQHHNLGYVVMEREIDALNAIRRLNKVLFMHQFICVKKGELAMPRSMKKHNLQSELHKLKQNEYGEVKRTAAVSYRR